MRNVRVVGLMGYARAGKDTAAAILAEIGGFEKIAFADALRELAMVLDPIIAYVTPDESVDWYGLSGLVRYSTLLKAVGYEQAKAIPDVRVFLQRLGSEGVRGVLGSETWVRAWKERVRARVQRGPANIVVTDVRFANEAAAVQEEGQLWRIVRPGTGPANAHVSESEQEAIVADVTIVATTLNELRQGVERAWEAQR